MDAQLTIIIRAQARQAQQAVQQTTQELSRMQRMVAALNRAAGEKGFFEELSGSRLIKAGKNLQWLGRQLLYNVTLPIALLGRSLFKAAMDFEAGMTQVQKVYGSLAEDQAVLKQETDALAESFKLLSSIYGVNAAQVAEVGAEWAAAGSAGRGLAENTKATLEAMILGDMEASQATQSLIAIQATWRLSTVAAAGEVSELQMAMAELNIVENETGISFSGLIEIFERAGGAARTAGMSIAELAAMGAALVPATGDATRAGNALRTIISRLQEPTQEEVYALERMGIIVTDPTWMGSSVTQKLQMVADHFADLSTANQSFVSGILASRWQVNRFSVLMADLNSEFGYYDKAVQAAEDSQLALATYQRELGAVLDSHPRKWEILKNTLRNTMMDAFIPMLPAIFDVMKMIVRLAQAFGNLDPRLQQVISYSLAFLALLGPIMVVIASMMEVTGVLGKGLGLAVAKTTLAIGQMAAALGWWLIPIAIGIAAIVVLFNDDLRNAVFGAARDAGKWMGEMAQSISKSMVRVGESIAGNIIGALQAVVDSLVKLPEIVARVFNSILTFLGNVMLKIYDLLSYLNPFARHSPSLVDNVRAGVSTILDEYSRLNKIGSLVQGAVTALSNFSAANASVMRSQRERDLREKANVPGVQGGNQLVDSILALEDELPTLTREIDSQSKIVARLTFEYDQAAGKVDELESQLTLTEAALSDVTNTIDMAMSKIADLARTPIQGMIALEDQIFETELAQNKLQMELLQFEKAGYSIDDIRDKYSKLNGDIEMLRSEQTNLRLAGAGSDILGVYDDQIKALQDQKGEMSDVESRINDIRDQLDALDLEKRFLDLTKAINFDPLERQIDRLATGVTELPFDEIVRQITEQKRIVEQTTPIQDALTKKVEAEKAALDGAIAARDVISAQLDVEQTKLDLLEAAYRDITNLISDMESMLSDVADVQVKVSATVDSSGAENFFDKMYNAGIGQDFPIYGGNTLLGREGDLADIQAFNEEMDKLLQDALGNLDLGNPFAGIMDKLDGLKKKWGEIWNGIKSFVSRWWPEILAISSGAATGLLGIIILNWGRIYSYITQIASSIATWLDETFGGAISAITGFFVDLYNDVVGIFTGLWDSLTGIWEGSGGGLLSSIQENFRIVFEALGEILWPFSSFFGFVWDNARIAVENAWNAISLVFDMFTTTIEDIILPVLGLLWRIVELTFKNIWGAIEFVMNAVIAIFGAVWEVISKVTIPVIQLLAALVLINMKLIQTSVSAMWDYFLHPILNAIEWVIKNVVGPAVNWLRDEVFEPVMDGITTVTETMWNDGVKPIFDSIKWVIEHVVTPAVEGLQTVFEDVFNGIMKAVGTAFNAISDIAEGGINALVMAFNILAGAVNSITGFLHIDFKISEMDTVDLPHMAIPQLAQGGVVGAAGGAFNSARAIVGEGSNVFPEFVIPTDPRYRRRALGLYGDLGMALGEDMPNYREIGGWGFIGDIADAGKKAVSSAIDAGKAGIGWMEDKALQALWEPLKWAANQAVGAIPNGVFKDSARGMVSAIDDWVSGADAEWNKRAADQIPPPPVQGPGSWKVIPKLLDNLKIPYKILSTFRPGATTRFTGQPSWHSRDRAIDLAGPTWMSHPQMLAIADAIYKAYKPYLKELIYGGPGAHNVFRGQDHLYSNILLNEHMNHVHASMARGGFIVPRRPGGAVVRLGEGMYNEKVQVLPLDGKNGGDKTFNFYGDLSFPNITDANDAESFLANLEALGS